MSWSVHEVPFDGYTDGSEQNPIPLGTVRRDEANGKAYMWVEVAQTLINDALAANEVCVLASATKFQVTNDMSAGLDATNPIFVGRANSACPESTAALTRYCWVQVSGIGVLKTDGGDDIALGDLVVADATVDGACDILAVATTVTGALLASLCGRALAADVDAADTVSVLIASPFMPK